jgi:hypothetical protein
MDKTWIKSIKLYLSEVNYNKIDKYYYINPNNESWVENWFSISLFDFLVCEMEIFFATVCTKNFFKG